MTTSTTQHASRPAASLGPLGCAPWCAASVAGHEGELGGDLCCCSKLDDTVTVTRRGLAQFYDPNGDDVRWQLQRLYLLLRQDPGDQPVVVINDETASTEVELLPSEARSLAAVLVRLADLLDQPAR